jgi:uncharacterized membrane protein YdfJ with MMPL/SSD domain
VNDDDKLAVKVLKLQELILDSVIKLEKNQSHTAEIARNTADMSKTLKESHQDNRDLVNIIAGKKQVPLPVVLIVCGILSLLLLIEKAEQSGKTIDLKANGVTIHD